MEAVGKYAAKKILGDQIAKHKDKKVCGQEDPFFELVPNRNGKLKKVKRRIPDYIPPHDAEVLARVRSRAYHLDMSLFDFLGMRFGWSSVIGLIPEVGDVCDLAMAINLYQKICEVECGIPTKSRRKMQWNICTDFLIGLVPIIGDLGDAAFKCNTKNAVILAEILDQAYGKDQRGQRLGSAARKRMSRELFTEDPEYVSGQPPPVYDVEPPAYQKETGIWAWLTGRTPTDGSDESIDIEKEAAPRRNLR